MKQFRFPKAERLHKKTEMSGLFKDGHFLYADCFKLIYTYKTTEPPLSIAVSIPKKQIKTAVARNKLKRRTKDCIRQNNAEIKQLCKQKNLKISAMLIYTQRKQLPYTEIAHSVDTIFKKLQLEIEKPDLIKS